MIEGGIKVCVIRHLPEALRATRILVADLLGVNDRTIQRLLKNGPHGTVSRHIGERSIRLLQIRQKAIDVLDTEEYALAWLHEPNATVAGRAPIAHARTELGCRQIESILDRVDQSAFS